MIKITFASILFISTFTHAADFGFVNVSENDFKDIISEFGSAFVHTSVSPASSLGKIFGIELGVIAGGSKTEVIADIANELDPASEADTLPHAGFLGAISFPMGFTAEINFLPEVKNSDLDFSTGSLGVKWTFTEVFPLPVDMAVKLHSGSSTIKWNQPVSSVATNIEYEQQVSGLQLQVSKKLTVFEPYLTLGTVKTTGKLSAKGSGTVFDAAYSTASSEEEEVSGVHTMLGFNVNLLILKLGLEAGKVAGVQTASAKVSLFF